jgi:hypothetical protein
MIVAIVTVHRGNGLLAPNGVELPLLYLTAALSLALTGPGEYSIDAVLGLSQWWTPQITESSSPLALSAGSPILAYARRRQPWRTRDRQEET